MSEQSNSKPAIASGGEEVEVVDALDEADEVLPLDYVISYYGADFPVDALVERLGKGDIYIPTFGSSAQEGSEIAGFQREYVWTKTKSDRFIESLLLGLPVPGIFLVKEKDGRLLVLDGHQRLRSLQNYYKEDINGRKYRLQNVQGRFNNKSFTDLDPSDRRRLNDTIIHATILRQYQPQDDCSSIYAVFERLNTGGVNLSAQEIRVALYHGELVQVLNKLNEYEIWRSIYGRKSKRMRDMELILRFFAFHYHVGVYRKPMKDFLNRYMHGNRNLDKQSESELGELFRNTVSCLWEVLGKRTFRPAGAINAAVMDSVMTGLARRLINGGEVVNKDQLKRSYEALLANEKYVEAIRAHTSETAKVKARMTLAVEAFAEIE